MKLAIPCRWIEHRTPDLAILDFKLKDGLCADLATALRAWDPVIVYSGSPRRSAMPASLQEVTWLAKHVDRAKPYRLSGTCVVAESSCSKPRWYRLKRANFEGSPVVEAYCRARRDRACP